MTQTVKVDAVSVVGMRHVWHRVTRVSAASSLTRVQTLARAVSPELYRAAIIENIRVMWIQPGRWRAAIIVCLMRPSYLV